MKKLLLSLFVIMVALGTTKAENVTFDLTTGYENAQPVDKIESGNVVITFDKGTGNNAPAWYQTGTALRVYAKGVITFTTSSTTEVIKSVTLTFAAKANNFTAGTKAEPVVSVGDYTENEAIGTWTGAAQTFTLTAGGTSGHARIARIEVELGNPTGVLAPTFSIAGGVFYAPQKVELACATAGATIYYTTNGDDPTVASSVYSNPIDVKSTMTIKAMASKDGKNSDVVSATYTIENMVTVSSIADFMTQSRGSAVEFVNPVNVIYQNGNYLYVQDATAALQIYGPVGQKYTNGDVIPAGFQGTSEVYGGLVQLKPISETFKAGTSGAAIAPIVVKTTGIDVMLMNKLVKVNNVTIENKIITDGSGTATLYARFSDVTIPADGKSYDVTAIVNSYNDNIQLFPIEFTESGPSGLAEVENAVAKVMAGDHAIQVNAAENARVLVVNNVGQVVANREISAGAVSIPVAAGFYIVKVNNMVKKVIVK